MSVRSFARFGSAISLAANLRLGGPGKIMVFATQNTYIRETSGNNIEVYVQGSRTASFEADGGILHGSWNVESSLVTSDRRLKSNIMPLQRTLRDVILPRGEKKAPAAVDLAGAPGPSAGSKSATGGDGALW